MTTLQSVFKCLTSDEPLVNLGVGDIPW